MKRLVVALAIGVVAMVGAAGPAWAHATISSPSSVPGNSDQRVTVDVPEERGDTVHNSDIKVYLPPDWTGLGCDAAAPWSCAITPNALEGRTLVEWKNGSGTPVTETFTLTAHTGAPGKYAVPVNQTYTNGETVRWIGAEGSEEPAPFITVTAAAATTTTVAPAATTTVAPAATTTTTTTAPGATTTTAAGATTTAVDDATTTTTTEAATTTTSESDDEEDGGDSSTVPILLALAVIVLGSGAATFIILRRRAGGTTAP